MPGPLLSRDLPHLRASQCEVCLRWGPRRLCADCTARFAPPLARCPHCALASPAGRVCGGCLQDPPPFARAVTAADYQFPWDRLVIDFKFHGAVELATPLAAHLSAAVRAADAAHEVDLVLPVPLAPARLAERGYNQAWELGRRLARSLGLPGDATLLERPADTAHQADLPRERRAVNLRGAFMVDPRRRGHVRGRRIALVDDVLTTGATAREATAALLRAGAASVQAWTLARTPEGPAHVPHRPRAAGDPAQYRQRHPARGQYGL